MTAYALAGYSIGLTGYAAIKVLSPAFYALDDAKTPMIVAIVSIAVNAVASFLFRDWLSVYGYGHVGVALATSSVALVNVFALALMMRKRIARINGGEIFSAFVKIAAASAAMSAVAYAVYYVLARQFGTEGFMLKLAEAFVPIGVGGVVFFVIAKVLGVKELEKVYNAFAKKLWRKK